MKYDIDSRMMERLDNDYKYHAPKEGQQERYVAIRAKAKELAILMCENAPLSRELSVALTELDHVVMMTNAAIARNE
jgi:flagellar biosynthesis protein FlhB